jgi:tRNA(Arg) A34 adenosine deaminase TadA
VVTDRDQELIRECYRLACRAVENGNHPFGALLARGGEIVLTAENTVHTDRDATRHAELNLVSQAMRRLGPDVVRQCSLYTSTEPCVMCCGAIYWAEIPSVYFGCSAAGLRGADGDTFLVSSRTILSLGRRPTRVVGPVLEDEGVAIHRAYWPRPGG